MNIKIGTRASPLAIAQAKIVQKQLGEYGLKTKQEINSKIIPIVTSGDRYSESLSKIGGKELFTKEIEEALIQEIIDVAVHSLKDVPAFYPEQITFGAFLKREMANDVLISHKYKNLSDIPKEGKIGTCSIRRSLQLPGYNIVPLRGNVDSRIKKCESENLDGIILAYAGLKRINMEDKIKQIIPYEQMIPSIGQGVIAVQILKKNEKMLKILHNIMHTKTEACVIPERAFIERVNGNCRTPIGGIAEITSQGNITFKAMIATKMGVFYASDSSSIADAKKMGEQLAEKLMKDSKFQTMALE